MYDWKYHSIIYNILKEKNAGITDDRDLKFLLRLGANFSSIIEFFDMLYSDHRYYEESIRELIILLVDYYQKRSDALKEADEIKEQNNLWYLSENIVGMMLYIDRFNNDINGLIDKIDYFEELGVNLIHLMPLVKVRPEENDGGYAVEDYLTVNDNLGNNDDLKRFISLCHKRGINVVIDMVLNHTSDTHQWAVKAKEKNERYMEYFYIYNDRTIPDLFEQSMPEVFPENAPGNFTYCEELDKWVMTVFHNYQWDINYTNPRVFLEVLKILLEYSNMGVDVIRLDAVAFLWKRIGTASQNENEAHMILQAFKLAVQIVSPSILFIAEAIVSPDEIIRYFGEGGSESKECDIAYNASLMVSIWDALATQNTRITTRSINHIIKKPFGTTWLNYARCHDDIGLGFADDDAMDSGYTPALHRKFLLEYYTGKFDGSYAMGELFMHNPDTGDARISGTLASLIGLEYAIERDDIVGIELVIRKILLVHSIIFSFGGIPLIYYGDEVGTCNDYSYLDNDNYSMDNRWMHRPYLNWEKIEKRKIEGSLENRIFYGLKSLILLRKNLKSFRDYNNLRVIDFQNEHLFAYMRFYDDESVLVINNISNATQIIDVGLLSSMGIRTGDDLITGRKLSGVDDKIVLSAYQYIWSKIR